MCGRAYETYSDEELEFRYLNDRSSALPPFLPTYNLCPTQDSPVLRLISGEPAITLMHWQLIPDWEPVFKAKLSTINAKSETIFQSSLFKDLIVRQRCIIPLSGFFEWKKDGARKRPFRIFLRDEPIMSVAGVWDTWHPGQPDERQSFSILTTRANPFMSEIHDRMPLILARPDEEGWLDPEIHEEKAIQEFLKPCPSSWLMAVETTTRINSAKNNGPEILEPAGSQDSDEPTPRLLF